MTTKYTLPNHNISTNPVYIKAQANGDGTFKLLEPDFDHAGLILGVPSG